MALIHALKKADTQEGPGVDFDFAMFCEGCEQAFGVDEPLERLACPYCGVISEPDWSQPYMLEVSEEGEEGDNESPASS